MIVTVTLSPALDRTYLVPSLRAGDLHRASLATVEASGKGVNISRVLTAHGVPTTAVLPVGGAEGRRLLDLLESSGVAYRDVAIAPPTRVNVTVLEPGGRTTKINAPAVPLTDAAQQALVSETACALLAAHAASGQTILDGSRSDGHRLPDRSRRPVTWLVCAGSFPPGGPAGMVTRLVGAARASGARVAVDTSGAALRTALDAGVDLVAPNGEELAELCGRRLRSGDEVVAAAERVAAGAGVAVLVTLGAGGAVLVDTDVVVHAVPPPIEPVNTAGAGDALLAGYLAADLRGASVADRLAQAVAWGTSACLSPGTAELPPEPVPADAVRVTSRTRRTAV